LGTQMPQIAFLKENEVRDFVDFGGCWGGVP
jgi:hypothetical protein